MRADLAPRLLPLALLALGCAAFAQPKVLSHYGDGVDPSGEVRRGPHAGIDFKGQRGEQVLASAEGIVQSLFEPDSWCAGGVRLWHQEFNRFTHYCYLDEVRVAKYDRVVRGQVIGTIGLWRPYRKPARDTPLLHFELSTHARFAAEGPGFHLDPGPHFVGCYAPSASYPTDRFVLTYPLRCR